MEPSKTSQTRWERHHNTFIPSLHLVPFCQLCFVFVSCVHSRVVIAGCIVHGRFTGFKWPPPSQLRTCTNSMTTCKTASESRLYLQPVVSPLCGSILVSKQTTALKGSRASCTLCRQKVAHGGGTTSLKNHLRTKHCSTYVQ